MKTNFKKVMLLPALVALFSMMFVGCNNTGEDGKEASSIEVSTETVTLEQAKNSSATVDVTANCDWIAQPDASWIQIPTKQGNGNASVKIIARNANDEIGSRTGNVTITSKDGNVSKTISVVQLGLGATVEVSATEVALENAPEDKDGVTVTSNVDWELSQVGDWFTVEQEKAGSRTQLSVVAKGYNETLEALAGKIVLTYVDGTETKTVEIAVSQAACVPSLVADPASVVFATTAAGETTFTLTAAGTWSIVAPEWATVEPKSGASGETTITVSVGENNAIAERAGNIEITGLGDAAIDVPVSQAGNEPKVTFSEAAVTVDCAEGTKQITINANYGWSANASADWISCEPGQGDAGESVITVKYQANAPSESNTGKEREGKLVITCTTPDGSATTDAELVVTQVAFDGDDLSATETANCYITTKAGYPYKFKATVKGNGQPDEESFITVTPNDLNVAGLKAIELWRDNQVEMLSNIRLDKEKGYIMFNVNENAPKGNTVIALAVMDEFEETMTTEIIWSWHIWTTNEDIEAKAMPITEYNRESPVAVTLMDRNLGAISNGKTGTDEDIVGSYGMHYEWGRKDPFPGCEEMISPYNEYVDGKTTYLSATRIRLYRTIEGQPVDVTDIFQGMSMGGIYEQEINSGNTDPQEDITINYSINNPTVYITGGGSNIAYNGLAIGGNPATWLYVPEALRSGAVPNEKGEVSYADFEWQTYLWGNSNNATTGTNYGTKTIYDPCPPGWRVPDYKAFSFAITSGGYSSNPLVKVEEQVKQSINSKEQFAGWDYVAYVGGDKGHERQNYVGENFGSQYKMESNWNSRNTSNGQSGKDMRNECTYDGFKAGYNIYTGGWQTGETMFFPMAGVFSYDSGNPCSDYSGFGCWASYATNAQDNFRAYASRMDMYAPSTYLTDNWSWQNQTKVHHFPGGGGRPEGSVNQASGMSVRCMKDVAPAEVVE